MKNTTVLALCCIILFAATGGVVSAAVPQTVNFQGYLTNPSGVPLTGSYDMTFRIYTVPSGGTELWTEVHNSANQVSVATGVYNVSLGVLTGFPANMFDNATLYLGITVGGDAEMTPRIKLDSSGFAIKTGKADTATDADTLDGSHASAFATSGHHHDSTYVNEGQADSITTAMIQNSAVTDAKIAGVSGSKVSGNIAGNAATATALAANPTDCGAGGFATAIDASGNLTCSTNGSSLTSVNAATVTNGAYVNAANTFTTGPQTLNAGNNLNKALIVKGASSQVENLQEWQNSTGAVLASVGPSGKFTLNTGDAFSKAMVLKGVVGQTENLQEWQNSTGSVLASVGPFGTVTVNTGDMSAKALIVKGAQFQSVNLQEWQDNTGSVIASVSSAGVFSGNGSGLTNINAGSHNHDSTYVNEGQADSITTGMIQNSAVTAAKINSTGLDADTLDGSHASAFATSGHTHNYDSSYVNVTGDTMTGALALPLGTAAAPSLTFSGDTNTGIYSPGADSVGIATGGANRMTLSSAGVNIGANQLVSTVSSGTAPLSVASSTLVANLNANMIEGQNLSALDSRYQHSVFNYPSTTAVANTNTAAISGAGVMKRKPAILVSGNPFFVYFDGQSNYLKAVQCANATCTPPHAVTANVATAAESWSDVAMGTDGFPVIAFTSNTWVNLVKCTSSGCATTNPVRNINTSVSPPVAPPSVTVNGSGFPMVSFCNSTGKMNLAVCNDPSCSGPVLREPDAATGCTATAVGIGTNTYPFVVYSAGNDLKLYQCANAACSSGSASNIYTGSDPVGGLMMQKASDGNPVIYNRTTTTSGSLIKCTNTTCTSSTVTSNLFGPGMMDMVLLAGDIPFFAFHDGDRGGLSAFKCSNTTCNPMMDGIYSVVETEYNPGFYPSIGLNGSGVPVIAHQNANEDEIRVTACGDTSCMGNTTAGLFAGNVMVYGDIIGNGKQLTELQHFAQQSVTNLALADNSVTTDKIMDNSIMNADINGAANISDTKLAQISTAGKVADTALSSNVAMENVANAFTQQNTFSYALEYNGAVAATNNSTNGWGVLGSSSGSAGRGVRGDASGASGVGVYGNASTTGLSIAHGLFGSSAAQQGRGVTGLATSTTANNNIGGYFETYGTASTSYGIHAKAPATGYAGYFDGRVYIDALNTTADSTVTVTNSNATYKANLSVEGDVIASGYNYQSTQTHSYRIAPQAFVKDESYTSQWTCNTSYCYVGSGTSIVAYAPVHLPQNATVTSYNCQIYDNDSTNYIVSGSFALYSRQWDSTTASVVGNSVSWSSTGPGASTMMTNSAGASFSHSYIENNYYVGYLAWTVNASSTAVRFYGCTVNYAITELLP